MKRRFIQGAGATLAAALLGLLGGAASASTKPILMPTLAKEIQQRHAIWQNHVFAPVGSLQPPAPPYPENGMLPSPFSNCGLPEFPATTLPYPGNMAYWGGHLGMSLAGHRTGPGPLRPRTRRKRRCPWSCSAWAIGGSAAPRSRCAWELTSRGAHRPRASLDSPRRARGVARHASRARRGRKEARGRRRLRAPDRWSALRRRSATASWVGTNGLATTRRSGSDSAATA